MICYHLGPGEPEKGLYPRTRVAIVSPLRRAGFGRGRQRSQSAGRWHVCTTRRSPNFGRSLRVNCPPEQRDALNQAAEDPNQRFARLKRNAPGVTNTEQLVFIAALNISYELTQEKAKTRDYASSMEQRIPLQQTIEQALLEQRSHKRKTGVEV